jgi:hypothetical protein
VTLLSVEVVIRAHPLIAVPIAVIIITAVSVRDSNRTEQKWSNETPVSNLEIAETSASETAEAS